MGPSLIHLRTAEIMRDERLRTAGATRRANTGARPEPIGDVADPHERQRALVCASLLMSDRRDASTHRRWA
jgi:hypothetical protein